MFYASARVDMNCIFYILPKVVSHLDTRFLIKLWDSRQRMLNMRQTTSIFVFDSCIVDIDAIILFTSAMCALRMIQLIR